MNTPRDETLPRCPRKNQRYFFHLPVNFSTALNVNEGDFTDIEYFRTECRDFFLKYKQNERSSLLKVNCSRSSTMHSSISRGNPRSTVTKGSPFDKLASVNDWYHFPRVTSNCRGPYGERILGKHLMRVTFIT